MDSSPHIQANSKRIFSRKFASILALIVLLQLVSCKSALAMPTQVIVDLFQAHQPCTRVVIEGPLEILAPCMRRLQAGTYVVALATSGAAKVVISSATQRGRAPLVVAPYLRLRALAGGTAIRCQPMQNYRHYKGELSISPAKGHIVVSNILDARDYVKSVVGSETNPDFPAEELKAQSVITQTLLRRYKKHDHLPDSTECEAYLGQDYVRPAAASAVDATWGETLRFNDSPAAMYFHAACAGGTSNGQHYFHLRSNPLPYLSGQRCNYCHQSPFFKEKRSIIPAFMWEKHFGNQRAKVLSKDERQRPMSVSLGDRKITGYKFWLLVGQKLGWDKMPGTRYAVENQSTGDVVLTSTGAGHGVGLCQWGAKQLALEGKTYEAILHYYFPSAVLKR